MPSDSISEGVMFQNFLGACSQTPLVLACFACLYASHTMSVNMLASPTSTMMTGLVVPPPFKSLDPPLTNMTNKTDKYSYDGCKPNQLIATNENLLAKHVTTYVSL